MLISDYMMPMLKTEREVPPISQQEQELQHPHHQVLVQILYTDWKTVFFFLNQTVIADVVELLHTLWGGSWVLLVTFAEEAKKSPQSERQNWW